jgi:hypothetical protein
LWTCLKSRKHIESILEVPRAQRMQHVPRFACPHAVEASLRSGDFHECAPHCEHELHAHTAQKLHSSASVPSVHVSNVFLPISGRSSRLEIEAASVNKQQTDSKLRAAASKTWYNTRGSKESVKLTCNKTNWFQGYQFVIRAKILKKKGFCCASRESIFFASEFWAHHVDSVWHRRRAYSPPPTSALDYLWYALSGFQIYCISTNGWRFYQLPLSLWRRRMSLSHPAPAESLSRLQSLPLDQAIVIIATSVRNDLIWFD